MNRGGNSLELRDDPTALAAETLLVFELTGSLISFAKALSQVPGLVLVGEEEGAFDEEGPAETLGSLYLAVPDNTAMEQILRLWDLYRTGRPLGAAHSAWQDVFRCLHDVRRWGPKDRVTDLEAKLLLESLTGAEGTVEIELITHRSPELQQLARASIGRRIEALGGRVMRSASYPEIAYDAVLVQLPADAIRAAALRDVSSLAAHSDIFAIRPQSLVDSLSFEFAPATQRVDEAPNGQPILAILDAVPTANHPLLAGRVIVDDPDDLAAQAAGSRVHGTAMASLAIWGDLNVVQPPLGKPIIVRPVMFAGPFSDEMFPEGRLVVDDIVRAVRGLLEATTQPPGTAPTVLFINISLGDVSRPFDNRVSPWARALDWLAQKYGVLFLVSAGNLRELAVPSAADEDAYRALQGDARTNATISAMRDALPFRRLIAPAESTNSLTIGATHLDAMTHPESYGISNHDPLPSANLPSPVSRHGPGFRKTVKPDLLVPGGRLRGTTQPLARPANLRFNGATAFGGLKVAGPTVETSAWSGATSGATALTSRAAHQIYEALEAAYGGHFTNLERTRQVLIVKALLVHRSEIPVAGRALVEQVFSPNGTWQAKHDSIQRVFGYGLPNWDETLACLDNRATIWGHGAIGMNDGRDFHLPLPVGIFGNREVRRISATLAWFTPILPGRRAYKAVRLQVEEPDAIKPLVGATPLPGQAGRKATSRGTLFHRCWKGAALKPLVEGASLTLRVSRQPDTADDLPDAVPFGLAVTLEVENGIEIYNDVRARLAIKPRIPALVGVRQ